MYSRIFSVVEKCTKKICTKNLVETAALSDINNPKIKLIDPNHGQYSRRNVHLNIKANNQVATVTNHLPLLLLVFEPGKQRG